MIDWNYDLIRTINEHYNKILNPSVDLMFFIRNFEAIYRMSISDNIILPDIFQDVMCYTQNGINAKHKILLSKEEEFTLENIIEPQRDVQLHNRHEAYDKSLDEYYDFIIKEVVEFVDKYPHWNKLIIRKQ